MLFQFPGQILLIGTENLDFAGFKQYVQTSSDMDCFGKMEIPLDVFNTFFWSNNGLISRLHCHFGDIKPFTNIRYT